MAAYLYEGDQLRTVLRTPADLNFVLSDGPAISDAWEQHLHRRIRTM